jgi:transcriptional regulator with XRE-family HTH domain
MMELIDAGKCIREAQQDKGLSNAEFARLAGTSPQQIIRWRRNRNMKLHTMQRAAGILGVTLIELIS